MSFLNGTSRMMSPMRSENAPANIKVLMGTEKKRQVPHKDILMAWHPRTCKRARASVCVSEYARHCDEPPTCHQLWQAAAFLCGADRERNYGIGVPKAVFQSQQKLSACRVPAVSPSTLLFTQPQIFFKIIPHGCITELLKNFSLHIHKHL